MNFQINKIKCFFILFVFTILLSLTPINVFALIPSDITSNRIAGADRIETAINAARAGWPTSDTVIVAPASDANLVDALAAAPLAGAEKAPILLTNSSALDNKTKQAIINLQATKVYAVGALQDQVLSDLKEINGITVELLKGSNRIDTASIITERLIAPNGTFVVGYNALADALSVASYAAANNYMILLANPDGSLPDREVPVGTIYVIGGQTLVKDIPKATRITGSDRFETNQKVLNTLSYSYSKVYVSNGKQQHLVDSLVGSSLAAKYNAPIVLGDTISAKAAPDIRPKLSADSQVIAFGGTSVIPDSVVDQVKYSAPDKPSIVSIKAINGRQLQLVFSQPIARDTVVDNSHNFPKGLLSITLLPFDLYDNRTIDGNYLYSELSSDGLTLTLTSKGQSYFDGTYSIYIADGITNQAGRYLGEFTTIISSDDQTAPSVSSIVYNSATNQLDVTYSEPIDIDNAGNPSVSFEGKPYTDYVIVNPTQTSFYYDASKWVKGTTISVTAAGGIDFLGNDQANLTAQSVTIEMNESNLQLSSVVQKNSRTIQLIFDKTIAGKTSVEAANLVKNGLSVLSNGKILSSTEYTIIRNDLDDSTHRTFDIVFIGTGPDYITLYNNGKDTAQVYLSLGESKIIDVFGNANQQISKTFTMNKVTTPPVLVSTKLGLNSDSIEIRFDKSLSSVDADAVSVRKNGYGTSDFTARLSSSSEKVVIISYNGPDLITNGTYTLYFDMDAVTDLDGNKTAGFNTTIAVSNTTNPITDVDVMVVGTNQYKVSYFDTDYTPLKLSTSALSASSYTLNGNVLPIGTEIYFTDSSKTSVIITLPANTVNYSDSNAILRNIRVYDDAGNKIDPQSLTVAVKDNVDPKLISASVSDNIMTLTFVDNIESNIANLKDLTRVLEIKGGNSAVLTGSDPVYTSAEGKKLTIVLSGGNWSTIKAYSQITVKTLATSDDTHAILGDGTNEVTSGMIINVVKS